jgi:hypothetical protein
MTSQLPGIDIEYPVHSNIVRPFASPVSEVSSDPHEARVKRKVLRINIFFNIIINLQNRIFLI